MLKNNNKGFTIIEILVATAILIILGAGFLGIQYIFSQHQVVTWKSYLSIEDANGIMTTLVKELRNMRQSDTGSYSLETALDQEIIFYSDCDLDGEVERIRYTLTGTQLTKGIIKPTGVPLAYPLANENVKVLTDNVRNLTQPIFYYYNSDWPLDAVNNPLTGATRISDTQLIKVILRLNTKASEAEKDYVLETYIQPRMLKESQ